MASTKVVASAKSIEGQSGLASLWFRELCSVIIRFGFILIANILALSLPVSAQERLRVVTTTTDLRSLVEVVGGDRVSVTNLVPPNVDPEDYQAKPRDIARLKEAHAVVRVGLDFDLWFDRLLNQAISAQPNIRSIHRGGPHHIDASRAIAVLDIRGASVGPGDGHAHGSGNPHYWLDPRNAEIITSNIREVLAHLDPSHATTYETNRQTFLNHLEKKLSEWETKLAPLQGQAIIAYHNSWAYFARRFRLNIVDFVEPRPGVPPSPARLARLVKTMHERKVQIILRQPHEPERNVAFLAQRTGAKIAVLAASVGALPTAQDYPALFETNVEALLATQPKQ